MEAKESLGEYWARRWECKVISGWHAQNYNDIGGGLVWLDACQTLIRRLVQTRLRVTMS